jgi:hypothetical protein
MNSTATDAIRYNDVGLLRTALRDAAGGTTPGDFVDHLRVTCKMTKRGTLLDLVEAYAAARIAAAESHQSATVESNHPRSTKTDA